MFFFIFTTCITTEVKFYLINLSWWFSLKLLNEVEISRYAESPGEGLLRLHDECVEGNRHKLI